MEKDTINSQKDLFGNDQETLSREPEKLIAGPLTSSEWPTLLATQKKTSLLDSSILPGQKTPVSPAVPEDSGRIREGQGGQICLLL